MWPVQKYGNPSEEDWYMEWKDFQGTMEREDEVVRDECRGHSVESGNALHLDDLEPKSNMKSLEYLTHGGDMTLPCWEVR